ncbi:MAG: hypothetical protein KBA51_01125 [Kiritimatiellae bacterium]|nr:hypothetical protein [Kiritimatiellia bacterium]
MMSPLMLSRPRYPEAYEDAWRRMAMAELDMAPDLPSTQFDARLRPVAASLSDDLTVARAKGLEASSGGRVRPIAYGLYFFPQTWMRMALMMGEALARDPDLISSSRRDSSRPVRIVDLGAGAGAGTWGALEALAAHRKPAAVEVWAVDREAALLRRFERMAEVARQRFPLTLRVHTLVADARGIPEACPDPDLVLAVFSANEWMTESDAAAWAAWGNGLADRLAPQGALALCEPASEASAAGIRAIRDDFCRGDRMRICWPCPHEQPCPMRGGKIGYCHEVRRWTPPPTVHRWGCALGREIGVVKFSGLVAARKDPASARPDSSDTPMRGRMVAPMGTAAGRLVTCVCAPDGQLHSCERLTRAMEREEIRSLRAWERGDSISMEGRVLGDGLTWRAETWHRLVAWE